MLLTAPVDIRNFIYQKKNLELLADRNMGSSQSNRIQSENITELSNETGFSAKEIQNIFERYQQLDRGNKGYLTRADFLRVEELTINPIGDRIVHSFFRESNSETVNFRYFLRILARFRPMDKKNNSLNSKEEKLKFIFRLYDLNDDDSITSTELMDILTTMTSGTISEPEVFGIVQQSISEADTDGNNQICFQEFYRVMKDEQVAEKMCIHFGR